jgi:hypothetical protein
VGRGQLAVFPRCSLLTYRFRYACRSRLEKQPTDLRRKTCLFRGQDTRMKNLRLFCGDVGAFFCDGAFHKQHQNREYRPDYREDQEAIEIGEGGGLLLAQVVQ